MELKIMVLMIIGVVAVALILTVLGNNMGVEYSQTSTAVASVCVPLVFMGITMSYLFDSKAPRGSCVICAGAIGIFMAYILNRLYSLGIFVDSFLATMPGTTISDFMAITVILWVIVGILFEVTRK